LRTFDGVGRVLDYLMVGLNQNMLALYRSSLVCLGCGISALVPRSVIDLLMGGFGVGVPLTD